MNYSLHNNGYVVKSLVEDTDRMYIPVNPRYKGIGRFVSWPLEGYHDLISKSLTEEAWEKWFSYQNVLEVVPEREYLQRYIKQCDALGINTQIIMVETSLDTQRATDALDIIECLGFDLINSVEFSYLSMDTDYFEDESKAFMETINHLNENGLCSSIDDVYAHLALRNNLISNGINLEIAEWGPFPARISIVKLN